MKRTPALFVCFCLVSPLFADVLEQNGVKIEFSDKAKTPDEVIVYTGSRAIPASQLLAVGIRPVSVQITNTSDKPVMINARSVNIPLLSPKKAVAHMQRSNSYTPYPYLESWGVYALWSMVASVLHVPGQWIAIPNTHFTTPQSPEILNTVGARTESVAYGIFGNKSPFVVRDASNYVKNLWNTPRSLHAISVFGYIMSWYYLSKIYFKNKRAEEIGNALGGQLRLYYPVLIAPGQVVNKVLLLDERKDYVSTLSFTVFAKNNQDLVATFAYALDRY